MNKNELIASIATAADLSKADASRAVDAVLDTITDALKTGDDVRLVGFGTFSVAHRAASEGRNPQTGEEIEIEGANKPVFKPAKALKDGL